MKNELIVLMGPAGSGKSTIARDIQKERPQFHIVSTDAIRKELLGSEEDQSNGGEIFKYAYDMIRTLLETEENVIFDAMNLRARDRKKLLREVEEYGAKCSCYVACATVDECKARQFYRERKVPYEVIERQFEKMQMPQKGEGWDEIRYYHGYHN